MGTSVVRRGAVRRGSTYDVSAAPDRQMLARWRSSSRQRRCSTMRCESQIASPSITSTGTRPGRSARRPPRGRACARARGRSSTSMPRARSSRATRPHGHSQFVGVLQRCRARSSRAAAPARRRPRRAASPAMPQATGWRDPARARRSPSRSRYHCDGRLDGLLVRARRPAELAPRLRRSDRSTSARRRAPRRGDRRPARAAARRPRRARAPPGPASDGRRLDARQARRGRRTACPGVVAVAEDVALAGAPRSSAQQQAVGDVVDVDDVDRAVDVGGDPLAAGSAAPRRSRSGTRRRVRARGAGQTITTRQPARGDAQRLELGRELGVRVRDAERAAARPGARRRSPRAAPGRSRRPRRCGRRARRRSQRLLEHLRVPVALIAEERRRRRGAGSSCPRRGRPGRRPCSARRIARAVGDVGS